MLKISRHLKVDQKADPLAQLFFLPLGLVSRDCQDHKGAGDPRQEDIGGAGNEDGER